MNAVKEPAVRKTLDFVDAEIAARRVEIDQLEATRKTLLELFGDGGEAPAKPVPAKAEPAAKRAYKKRDKSSDVTTPKAALPSDDNSEPESLGAAMKLIGKQLGKFTSSQLREAVKAKYPKLFEEVGPSAFSGNLGYWTKVGKLTLAGDGDAAIYTVVNLNF